MNWTTNHLNTNRNKLEKTKISVYMNRMAEWKKEVEAEGRSIYDIRKFDLIYIILVILLIPIFFVFLHPPLWHLLIPFFFKQTTRKLPSSRSIIRD